MPVKLSYDAFTLIRSQTGAAVQDAAPTNGASVVEAQCFGTFGQNEVALYWAGTGAVAGNTVDIEVYIYDGPRDLWVLLDAVYGLQRHQVALLNALGAPTLYARIINPVTAGTDLKVYASAPHSTLNG